MNSNSLNVIHRLWVQTLTHKNVTNYWLGSIQNVYCRETVQLASPLPAFRCYTWKTGRSGRPGDVIRRGLGRSCVSPPTRPRIIPHGSDPLPYVCIVWGRSVEVFFCSTELIVNRCCLCRRGLCGGTTSASGQLQVRTRRKALDSTL